MAAGDCLKKFRVLPSSVALPLATGTGVWAQVPRAQACGPSSDGGGTWDVHLFRNRVQDSNLLLSLGSRGPWLLEPGDGEPWVEGFAEAVR